MATTDYALRPVPQVIAHEVKAEPTRARWTEWFTTTDHKKIGILYIVTTFAFFLIGGVEALLMRLQLGEPNNNLITPEHYNELFTLHGTTMIFLFVVPMMAGFANYFLPLMIGARDMAFPRLNALSYWSAGSSSTARCSGSRRRPAGSPTRRSPSTPSRRAAARTRGST